MPVARPVGRVAVLLDCGSLDLALAVFASLTAAREGGALCADEIVPAAETVLVSGGASQQLLVAADLRSTLNAYACEPGGLAGLAGAELEIPVVYDGADLTEVATLAGFTTEQFVLRHTSPLYNVAFLGFAPGFAYLSGGDPALHVPRKATPRTRVPAGSLAIAGEFSAVYPRESPGGWQLLGHTDRVLWDPSLTSPSTLEPGTRVRFTAVRDRVSVLAEAKPSPGVPAATSARLDDATHPKPGRESAGSLGRPAIKILDPGLQTLFQDAGRPGFAALGVSPSGAVDRSALHRSNRLVGNAEAAPALEIGPGSFRAAALGVTVCALTGAPRNGSIVGAHGRRRVEFGRAFRIDDGEVLHLDHPERGVRTMLAVRGFVAPSIALGSASRDTLADLGPEPLKAGDVMGVSTQPTQPTNAVGLPEEHDWPLPSPSETVRLRVDPGPRDDWFAPESKGSFWRDTWRVTALSDRVGVRLAGEPLTRSAAHTGRELPSEGLVRGAIQVPADGQPLIFLSDHPVTGGYPVIGVIHPDDLDLAAQLPEGASVRFTPVTATRQPSSPPGSRDHSNLRAKESA